ncbi:MAG: DUF1573 domain-containing protein [Phycisphaerae bacterium]|nr:DUF1573 domain-containing protein [Phycisphaerae bacterium]
MSSVIHSATFTFGKSVRLLCAFAASAVMTGALASPALAQKDSNKDKDVLREQLREKMDALHKEVINNTTVKPEAVEQVPESHDGVTPTTVAQATPPTAPQAPIGEGARLVFDSNSHDFGVVMGDTPLVCKFPFKNMGTGKLVINAVNTGCGCTVAKLAKQEFEPGEGDVIELTYSPKGAGKQQRSIQVASNDAQQPNMQIVISAQVVPLVEARPNTLQFGQVSIGEARTVQLVIVSRDPEMKITAVESNGPEIVAEIAGPDVKPEVMVEPELPGVKIINVTLKDTAPVGRVLKMLTVKTLAAKEKGAAQEAQEIKVNAFAAVKGELTVNPQLIRVPPVVAGGDIEREAIVTRKDNKPFNITKVEIMDSTLPGLTATTEPYSEGDLKGFKIKLKGKAGPSANNFRGRIVFTTDVEREESNDIQFSGIVRVPPPEGSAAPAGNPTGTTPPKQ